MSPRAPIVHSTFYARTFALLAVGVLGYFVFRIGTPFFGPMLWAFLIAALLYPQHKKLTARLNDRPAASATIISVAGVVLLLVPLAILATIFGRQAAELLTRIQEAASTRHIEGLTDVLAMPALELPMAKLKETTGIEATQVVDWATAGAQSTIQFLLGATGNLFVGALGAVGNFLLVMFFLFFFLRDGRAMLQVFVRLVPMPNDRKAQLVANLLSVANAVVLGTLVTAAVQGTLVGVGFAIASLPSAIVFGVLASISSLVPMVGTLLVWGPAALVLVAQGRTGWAIFMVAWGVLVVSMVDNVLRPLLVSGKSGVSTLLVFAGVLGGLSAFGSVGLFIGPLILTLMVALIRYADELIRERESSQMVVVAPLAAAPVAALASPASSEPPAAAAPSKSS
jgi:predicted PurR-regulated permease PerM